MELLRSMEAAELNPGFPRHCVAVAAARMFTSNADESRTKCWKVYGEHLEHDQPGARVDVTPVCALAPGFEVDRKQFAEITAAVSQERLG